MMHTFSQNISEFSPPEISENLFFPDKIGDLENFLIFRRRTFFFFSTRMHTFSKKFLDFHPPKFLMTFFFQIPPISLFLYISPLFRENYSFPPPLTNLPPVLDKFTCFLYTLRAFHFPLALTMMHLCITQCTYWMPLFKPK